MCCSSKERNWGLPSSKIFWQSSKISAKESCLYGIIVTASPFGGWLIVSSNSILPQTSEEMFYFETKNIPYLCGFRRFANTYRPYCKKGVHYSVCA